MNQAAYINTRIDGIVMMAGAGYILWLTFSTMSAISNKINMNPTDAAIAGSMIHIEWRYGLFLTIAGAIAMLVGGFQTFREETYY